MSWPRIRLKAFPPPRGWGAFLYTPVISLYALGVTLSFMFMFSAASESQRIDYLGSALIFSLGLILFGGAWLQRRGPLRWAVKMGALEVTFGHDPEAVESVEPLPPLEGSDG